MHAYLTAAAVALIVGLICWAIITTRPRTLMDMADSQLQRRSKLPTPSALPAISTRHTALDSTPARPAGKVMAPRAWPQAPQRVRPAPAPMNDRIRQRIAHCATVRAHEDHFNGISTDCPLTGDDEAAAIWSRAYAVALQRIADLRELHNVPPTPAARPTAHVQRAEAELFGRQYAPTDLAPA